MRNQPRRSDHDAAQAADERGEGRHREAAEEPWRHRDARHRRLHAPVLDDDQRRSAAGAGAGHPGKQSENKALQAATKQVVFDVESGQTVADALRKQPKAFNELYVNMVAAGEAGGILDTILMRLATFIEKTDALVRKVKSAMIYPVTIMTVAAAAIAILLIFVIPTFEKMFAGVGLALPLPTRIVIGCSKFLQGYWWALLGGGFGAFVLINRYYATDDGRLRIDGFLLKVPVLGDVLRKSAVSRFTRTLGTLISSGVPILDGLDITARTCG
ncbi:MAG: type II secretion system F family protein [Gemmatimonadaceae bacterium]|nr:type II secretion system F family protein [Gemmatimonadaceae bacterium]